MVETATRESPKRVSEKSVLWVDLLVSSKDPTTKHLVSSVPYLIEAGWQITVWCQSTDIVDPRVRIEHIPKLPLPFFFNLLWFPLCILIKATIHFLCDGRGPARVVHTSGGHCIFAHVSSFHFINHLWTKVQLDLGFESWRDAVKWIVQCYGVVEDWVQFKNPFCKTYLGVSISITNEILRCVHDGARVELLPNSYDEARFNPSIRELWRERMRAELGFAEEELVFIFVSQGHYRRKGFWLAVEALDQLRNDTPKLFKFLVVGGQPATLTEIRKSLNEKYPGWERWLIFSGPQSEIEKYYAAADAFLFPSYFEAFCLAEIEAAACGLPLLLTPHHGAEMILRDGENGIVLSYDPRLMSQQIRVFLEKGAPKFTPGAGLALTKGKYAAAILNIYEQQLIQNGV